jgi:hypothetical protein
LNVTVTHVGATKKYVEGWEVVFGKKAARKPKAAARSKPPRGKKAKSGKKARR